MNKRIVYLTSSALFAAFITLTTAYLFHIPIGSSGYVHLGDAFVCLAAAFLPTPYAAAAAAIGGGLADLLTGAPMWAPFTVVIKAVMTLCLTSATEKIVNRRNILGGLGAAAVNIIGYYFAEVILYGNWITPLLNIPTAGLFQSGGGFALFVILGLVLDAAKVKQRLLHRKGS